MVDTKGKIRVLVYGTLKAGHGNHRLLTNADAEFVGYDSVTLKVKMTNMGGFPGVYRPLGQGDVPELTVKGEVWAIEPEGLESLDYLEGHPTFYRREKLFSNHLNERVWIYILSPQWTARAPDYVQPANDIPEGIWQESSDETEYWKAA